MTSMADATLPRERPSAPARTEEALLAGRRVGVFSPGIRRIPHLQAFLGAARIVFAPGPGRRVDAVVGWGRKPNTRRARVYAQRHGVPFVALEDGFLRSLDLGVSGEPPLSLVVDDVGIYYDSTRESRLERLIHEGCDEATSRGARRALQAMRAARLSKYNAAPERTLGPHDEERVLVVDQTAGDQSLALGGCDDGTFERMLSAAIDEHPEAEIWVKTHPDVAAGKRRGHAATALEHPRVRLLTDAVHPICLLEQVDRVFVMTSLLGFEALLHEKPVTCFGAPFYAGWGLTDDRAATPPRRRARPSVEDLFAAAYLRYARYVDPETGARCPIDRVIEHPSLQRELAERDRGAIAAVGFSAWKRSFLPRFVGGPGTSLRFTRRPEDIRPGERRLVWGSRPVPTGREIWRMEDGFLRSVGLGSDLHAPASLVVDRLGIYYDPRQPSELERMLEHETFSDEELSRAHRLRDTIVRERLSKYNLGLRARVGPPRTDERRVALVVGQVEDDASIQLGTLDIRRNETLLREAAVAAPHAHLVYKPHPDVVSGNRRDSLPLHVAQKLCDEVVTEASLADCLDAADEVHTMTSLVGFEALLRELDVVVYGQPFYAGWGLTRDRHPHPRRTRRRSLDELVAATLIRYPRYVSRVTRRPTTPEIAVAQLLAARRRPARATGGLLTKLLNLAKEVSGVS